MRVYCTSKNTGPSWQLDPVYMVYLGTSLDSAVMAVGDFVRYEKGQEELPKYLKPYTALPENISFVFIKYYMADGWWYSIVEFELEETNEIQT